MIADLKYFDGSLAKIDRIPADLRALYATAFEVDARWIIEAAARRQKWIDQAQSLNIYMAGVSGKKLDETYKTAWLRGLKTTYYLRTMGATHTEKSTSKAGALNAVAVSGAQNGMARSTDVKHNINLKSQVEGPVCMLRPGDVGFEECEACQ
jgi:ribonucleoside-diphosphate reductase alpha chain